ncbi:MAG: cyclic nucleotide-binding domain-containing protein [Desulforhabdus sp.]|nr:cyclic nucleotide-binding domain-containing protein [Desulforhabdus sp.]
MTEGLRCESIIQKMPLFTSLEDVERDHLLTSARCLELPPDTILMHEGDRGDHCYFILSGELEILKNLGTADQQILNVRGRGHCVGEISLLNPDKPRSASVRTRTQARLLEMTRETFRSILNRHPAFAHDLACYMSSCLCESNETSLRELKKKSRQLAVAYKDLQEARAQATGKERLERELEIAWEIQQNILPSTLPSIEGLDMGARMLPARVVGGDFFDIIRLDAETLGIAVGDVSGKGIAALSLWQ